MIRRIRILTPALAVLLAVNGTGCSKTTGQDREAVITEPDGRTQEKRNSKNRIITENTENIEGSEEIENSQNIENTENQEHTESREKSQAIQKSKSPDNSQSDRIQAHKVGSKKDDYILPEAQTHVYTPKELSGLSGEELRFARNEIYARHGRIFNNSDLDTHFQEKKWYKPAVEADAFEDSVLNKTELENLKAIKAAEEWLTMAVITCPKIGRDQFPRIDGSTATLPISQAIYRLSTGASQSEAEAEIKHEKTTRAYLDLIWDGGPDLVIAYAPGDAVKKALKENNNLIMKPIGRDALVFLSNDGNPVNSLTQKQIVNIYSGKLTNWDALGGKKQEIKAFQRPTESGSQNLMEELVMKGTPMAEAPQYFNISEMAELINKVSSYDNTGNALGYSVYFYAKNMYRKPGLKFMAVDKVAPASHTIRDGSYPYVSDFYAAIQKDEPKDSTAYQLFEWLTSDDGQALLNQLGYVGIKDVEKALPEEFEEEEEFTAEIPLPQGKVILADGDYLYGENGIGIFDSSMHLKKFIRNVTAPEVSSPDVFDENSLLCAVDTLTGKYGIYSIKEGWACPPEYTEAVRIRDGFSLEKSVWNPSDGSWHYTYDYADKNGRIIRSGVKAGERVWEDEYQVNQYPDREEFAQKYPELLNQLGVGLDDISIERGYKSAFIKITKEHREYYYDINGKLLLKFDTEWTKGLEDSYWSPVILDGGISYMRVFSGKSWVRQYYVYQDGLLIKEIVTKDTENSDISIQNGFYLQTMGNYIYIYNFKDEPCAKFLLGYYRND